jgi:polar amino acid transport system ATP-binding protein
MIRAENITKRYGDKVVLDRVCCHIPQGQTVSVIGPSGAGKSVFLRCLNHLEEPTEGCVYIDGVALTAKNAQQLRRSMGMVFQHFNLFEHWTVLDNLTYAPVRVLGQSAAQARQKALDLLDSMGLAGKAQAYPVQLSGGQKQRVAIARALAMEPRVLLFDEPTSALDPESVKGVLGVIRQVIRLGMTVVLVTHEMAFARELSDTIFFFADGRLIEQATPKAFFEDPKTPRARHFLEQML